MNKVAEHIPYCVAEWLPSDQDAFTGWMAGLDATAANRTAPLHPAVRDFGAAVEQDPALFALVHQMFDEVPDAPPVRLMCFMAVGMAEVSTCDVTVAAGQHVAKGGQLGMFHFGGSTCCLLFRPGTPLDFDLHGQTPGLDATPIPINARIATVRGAAHPKGHP